MEWSYWKHYSYTHPSATTLTAILLLRSLTDDHSVTADTSGVNEVLLVPEEPLRAILDECRGRLELVVAEDVKELWGGEKEGCKMSNTFVRYPSSKKKRSTVATEGC